MASTSSSAPGWDLLLVDANQQERLALLSGLQATVPVRVHQAESVEEGLSALQLHDFDCAIVDWSLPDGAGANFVMRAGTLSPDLPVIVLALADHSKRARSVLRAGAQDVLLKNSVTPERLVERIHHAIERKRATSLRIRLQRANRQGATAQLASGVAHEINNPATWMADNLQLLQDALEDAQDPIRQLNALAAGTGPVSAQELAEILRAPFFSDLQTQRGRVAQNIGGLKRITRVVRALQGFSRVSERRAQRADPNDCVRDAAALLTSELRHRCTVSQRLGELPPMIIDVDAIVQLVVNLVLNACQAMDRAPHQWHELELSTQVLGGMAHIRVADSGPGIPAGAEDQIFEPFFTTRPRDDGAGMGLSVCREIAKRHGGSITASRSALGGAQLTVSLPLLTGLISKTDYEASKPATPKKTRMDILIVDDEALIARALSRVLRGHSVTVAISAVDGLDAMSKGSFDGVICDLMMPRHDGAWFLDQVQALHPEHSHRVVLMTGGAMIPRLKAFLTEQTDRRVLEKPFSREAVSDLVSFWQGLSNNPS